MGETIDDVAGRLRGLAIELVRSGRTSDAAAVLAGIGAVEMLSMFSDASKPSVESSTPSENHNEHQHEYQN
jgi:hypothetical protein